MATKLFYKDNSYTISDGETVLDCLLREQITVPYSCKSGVCQSCLMQALEGAVPEEAQKGLKQTFKERKLFLACQCCPVDDITIQTPDDAGIAVSAVITEKTLLNHNVLKLRLQPEQLFECEPGQYLTLINPSEVARSYSIANNPQKDQFIELHIRLLEKGMMSQWLKNESLINGEVTIQGPAGNCFYSSAEGDDYPIILAGTGTGLAPLYGIIHEALAKQHKGNITLFHGALNDNDLYLTENLQLLDRQYQNFTYVPCVLEGAKGNFYQTGDIHDIVLANLPADKTTTRLFLCGAPQMVNSLKTKAFLSGVSSKYIYADAFLPSKN